MRRSRLRRLYLKKKPDTSRIAYIKQCNYCRKSHYGNLDEINIADNKQFWRAVKPVLSDKVLSPEK